MTILPGGRDSVMVGSVETAYRLWPATIDGNVEEKVQGGAVTTRPLTAAERQEWSDSVAAVTAGRVTVDLHTKAREALTANATFLAIATPNAAQNAAQAKALTRQVNAMIRLQLGELTEGTDT